MKQDCAYFITVQTLRKKIGCPCRKNRKTKEVRRVKCQLYGLCNQSQCNRCPRYKAGPNKSQRKNNSIK